MKRLPILQLILLWLLSCGQLALADRITYFYYDATGTAIMAKDEQANVLWKRAPTAYGETPEFHPAMKKYNHRMTVAGHYDDWETGLIYMGKRYYSPKLGRFLTPDPVGVHPHLPQSFNRYGYANNNPYKFVDPDGGWAIPAVIVGVAGYLGGMGADAISQYAAFGQVDWAGAATSSSAVWGGLTGALSFSGIGALKAAGNAAKMPLAPVLEGHGAGQGFTGVFDSATGKVLIKPSTGETVIPQGWVQRAGGHADVSAALGGDAAGHSGFAVILQENGSLNITWRSGTLNRTPGSLVPAAQRQAIIDAVKGATGRTVNH